ncbi:dienelactone hydrolase [Deinococcus taeanensis]|uniref:alpha/beta hydrolase family protein n=1 Tax=Deinococcus taeanensis TaxID=2737050 RepID=UPI001CDC77B0|nr:dienelactone hydrolase [Deinococcus taeanensis]UBV43049.1 dienelactone hydrolase [Deinococcus taeanensis]
MTAPSLSAAQTTAPQATAPARTGVPGDLRPDAPELAARGQYAVGVRTLRLVHPDQPDLARAPQSGPVPRADRPLTVEVWYPTGGPSGTGEVRYRDTLGTGVAFDIPGRATRDAAPVAGQAFPLLIVSHGYTGSRYLLSYLTENLASKGYVVAAIDHTDSTHGNRGPFSSTLVHRAPDINFTLDQLARLGAPGSGSPLSGAVNASRTALIGYSMGGYGVLNAAGAGYAPAVAGLLPGGTLKARQTGAFTPDPRIRAVVAFAPWGGPSAARSVGIPGAEYGFWDAAGLAGLKVPTLFVVGDHDDVSGFEDGVKPLFEHAVNADRYLLVYQRALHNVAPNPAPAEASSSFAEYEHYADPVWDSARLNNINQHFVTAFLKLTLNGDQSAAPYLNVPGPVANNPKGSAAWKGFRDRTALGLELYHLKAR